MKQYLLMKLVKRGFKVWVRADSITGYFCDFEVYVGRTSEGTTTEVGLGERVALQLTDTLRGKNYQIFSDNYFTTAHLLNTLLTHSVSLQRGEHTFCQRGNLMASVWMGKKPVTVLSTLT